MFEITAAQAKELMPFIADSISDSDRYAVSQLNGMIFKYNDKFESWFFTGYRAY